MLQNPSMLPLLKSLVCDLDESVVPEGFMCRGASLHMNGILLF